MNNKLIQLIVPGLVLALIVSMMGCSSTPSSPVPTQTIVQQPVDIVSVLGPLQPINPGGPIVEITLKNASSSPIVSLNATLDLQSAPPGRPFTFDFNITSSDPLLPHVSTASKLSLIGGGFGDSISYPLTISGATQGGMPFTFTTRVQIVSQAESITVQSISIPISPASDSLLTNSESVSSQVLLIDAQVNKGVSDKQYMNPWYPAHTVNPGDPILVISGSIQNKRPENKEIAMYAQGYDASGQQVAWTLDAAHIAGQIGLRLEKDETGQFALHLNAAENIKSIRIFANNYSIAPP